MATQVQTHGVQQLLTAEKRATDKVSDARRRKARKLKQAKDEAEAEIEKYRNERERQFRDYLNKTMGSKGDVAATIEIDTKRRIEDLNRAVVSQKETVIRGFLELIEDIKPTIHQNFQK